MGTLTGAALAQDPSTPINLTDPGDTQLSGTPAAGTPAGNQPLDTAVTPSAKGATGWNQLAGAGFPDKAPADGTPATLTTNFFTVRFLSGGQDGYAAGSACENDSATMADLDTDTADHCLRVPAIWHYHKDDNATETWTRVYKGDGHGFVGGIAYANPDGRDVIAVGGSGKYPRTELARKTGESDADYLARDLTEGAGRARVWRYAPDFYGDDEFHEISESELPSLPDGTPMHGLTALDCAQTTSGILAGRCFAGGLQQIWEWKDGDFVSSGIGGPSTGMDDPTRIKNAAKFLYRVRQIRFMPGDAGGQNPDVVAMTAGCCGASAANNEGAILTLDNTPGSNSKWDAELLSHWTFRGGATLNLNVVSPGGNAPRDTVPDSLWAFMLMPPDGKSNFGPGASIILSPGGDGGPLGTSGPATPADSPASQLLGSVPLGTSVSANGYVTTGDPTGSILNAAVNSSVSSVRLVSGDGDFHGPPQLTGVDTQVSNSAPVPDIGEAKSQVTPGRSLGPPDRLMDWAVGELRSTGQGVAYTTLANGTAAADTVICPGNPLLSTTNATEAISLTEQCKPGADAGQVQRDLQSTRLFKLPVYELNAFQYAPDTETAWAVGDRGAILRLGGDASALGSSRDPQAPVLGSPASSALPDASTYDAFRPLSADSLTGIVPPLAARPERTTAHPGLVADGTPDTGGAGDLPDNAVTQIAMSRDGQEGWAVGSGYNDESAKPALVLDHYNGWNWTRCDPDGVPRQLPADPACASLAPLETYFLGSDSRPVSLGALARVPLENDGDASNDDDFEAVAFGELYQPKGSDKPRMVALRYRSGVWSLDTQWMQELDIEQASTGTPHPRQLVMTSPTEGWLAADLGGSGSTIFQLHDGHWKKCVAPGDCDGLYGHVSSDTSRQRLHLALAGSRVYLTGFVSSGSGGATTTATQAYPVILHLDPGDDQWNPDFSGCVTPQGSSTCSPTASLSGEIKGLVVRKSGDGYAGWAVGNFGGSTVAAAGSVRGNTDPTVGRALSADATALLQLDGSGWKPVSGGTAIDEQFLGHPPGEDPGLLSLDLPGGPSTLIAPGVVPNPGVGAPIVNPHGSLLGLSPGSAGWGIVPTPFDLAPGNEKGQAGLRAVAPDNQGGFWAAVHSPAASNFDDPGHVVQEGTFFYHYTNRVHDPVFSEIAHPIQRALTATAGGADGTFWAATDSNQLYRYDRLTGWGEVKLKGWDPGVVTNPSPIYALAVGPDGTGLAVGKGGRIADLSPVHAILDVASGKRCSDGQPPCSTGHDLRAAAIGPGGAALVGGTDRALLYRDTADGAFRAVTPPPTSPTATITGISFPSAGQAFVTTSTGQVYEGPPSGGAWVREAVDGAQRDLSLDSRGITQSLKAISVGADGVGFAVGDRGVIIQRNTDGTWQRLHPPLLANLTSVALPANGHGSGALIGGSDGLVLTLVDGKFEIARPPDYWDPTVYDYGDVVSANTVGVALLPGNKDGAVEAFAATQGGADAGRRPWPAVILHYSSDPSDPLLSPGGRVQPLPDSPAHVDGEMSFAAFGKSDCHDAPPCQDMAGSNEFNERVAGEVADDIAAAGQKPGGPQFALFTGDVDGTAGQAEDGSHSGAREHTPLDANVMHANWLQLIASRIRNSGLPLFGAIGVQDLDPIQDCASSCNGTAGTAGTSTIWQAAMAGMPTPWGDAAAASHDGLSFVPVGGDPKSDGKAQTHYAFEVKRGDQALALVAVVDSSLKSLTVSDANQNPVEDQLTWLDDTLGNRPAGLPAIVVTEDPTYSYGPGALSDTSDDATQLETILLRDHVSVVVSGRLGYNGLYWATAPGLHYPCAGGNYPDPYKDAPAPGSAPNCGGDSQSGATNAATNVAGHLAGTLQGLNAPVPVPVPSQVTQVTGDQGVTGSLPFVIAATAGGTFGPQGHDSGGTAAGFWHGYTTIRLIPGMQPVVEQRPVLDWVGVTAPTHVLAPGQHMQVHGYGREPLGNDVGAQTVDINSPAVTHRFDLIEADPDRPWLPNVDPSSPFPHHYVPIDSSIAAIDRQTGNVTTGRGSHPRVYALAVMSIGNKVASWPLDLEPRRSFHQKRALTIAAPTIPAIRVLGLGAASLNPPSASPPSTPPPPVAANLQLPNPPALPTFPSATPAATPPPAPPAPPPPPSQQQAMPLNLTVNPVGVAVPPATGVTAQPTPPVNPAPPSGARREAKQRQAATAKSEEGGGEQAGGEAHGRIDAVDSPNASATRLDPRRPEPHHFTAVTHQAQASAWTTELEWGGGITLMALALAMGFITVRPTPRRRTPDVPAPAYARRKSTRI